jgi:peptidoglycan/LPS O-acetylase OafA/YrhL
MRTASRKLDQLTSLRFFAALMIVIHHSAGLFGTGESPVNFGQGVSFFFVLSGFILTYVYPQLEGFAAVRKFWRARVARIWPAHIAALVLGALLAGYSWWGAPTLLANVTMVQSWLGMSKYYFSFNAVSWSISTEFFFYLVFPLLILRWDRTWWWKLPLVLGVLLALFAYSNGVGLPAYGDPAVGDQGSWVTQHGLIYIHPVARLFEFTSGMCIALAWRRTRDRDIGIAAGTVLELLALAACVVSMAYMNWIAFRGGQTVLGDAGRMWLMHAGSMFAFGGLIYVCALGRGWVTRLLALPGIVLLGEISYSMYLVHQQLLHYYKVHLADFAGIPDATAATLFMAILLLLSYLMWSLVEMPGRRLLVGGSGSIHGTGVLARSWTDHLQMHRRALAAAVALVAVIVVAHVGWRGAATPAAPATIAATPAAPAQDAATVPPELREYAGTNFGADATLQGLEFRCADDALELRTAWASGNGTAGALRNAVHVVDQAGAILTQFDYPQPAPTDAVRGGGVWLDPVVRMPYARLRGTGAWRIALGVYDQASGLRKVDRGVRDWGDRRLVIPLPACARAALRASAPTEATARTDS